MTTAVATMKLEKVTKGALRYKQTHQDGKEVKEGKVDEEGVFGTLYVRKAYMEGEPDTIKVTMEY